MARERTRFIEDYDDYIDQARLDLGRLFRLEDYPSKEALRNRFSIAYRIVPVPDADHFMAELAAADTERVKRDIERRIEERLHGAVGDLYRRLGEAVEHVSERLREDGEGKPLVFRDSLIENIRSLVDVAPRLNIFGDDELARLCEQVKDRISVVDPDTLRPSRTFDPAVRARVKRDADALTATVRRLLRAGRHGRQGGGLMDESRRRVSDCVTALLREQPFFGSLALRLPIRADAGRETLASDGRDIRYSPEWVADTNADLIKTALGRRGAGLRAQAPHEKGRPGSGALAARLAARHARAPAGRGLRPAARRRGLGRRQRGAGLRPAPEAGGRRNRTGRRIAVRERGHRRQRGRPATGRP